MRTGDVLTFAVAWIRPFDSDPMPRLGRRFAVGRRTVEVVAVRPGALVFDAVVL